MLGQHVFLRQPEEGVGEVMQGRKKMRWRRRGTKAEADKKRVKERKQAAFMDRWAGAEESAGPSKNKMRRQFGLD